MTAFANKLLEWFDRHGRKDLPWQARTRGRKRDPYAVWVSEIMLQQTQVATVIPYFQRFMARFPALPVLAQAPLDEVLHHWTGLGYYARARNLHQAAQAIMAQHHGAFPRTFAQVAALPGIGESTAGAILAFAFNQHHAILDGNVKRVLARYHAVTGWPGDKTVAARLWQHARRHTPAERVADYTQAIMDLGATVCRRKPECARCPVAKDCAARRAGNPGDYPAPSPRRALPVKATVMLMIRRGDNVLLERRPPSGVWGGLWVFPQCAREADASEHCRTKLGVNVAFDAPWARVRHGFTHFRLDILPVPGRCRGAARRMENADLVWYNLTSPDARGLAAPVKRLLEQLRNEDGPNRKLREAQARGRGSRLSPVSRRAR